MHQRGWQALFFGNRFRPQGADHPVNDKNDPARDNDANRNGIHDGVKVRAKVVSIGGSNLRSDILPGCFKTDPTQMVSTFCPLQEVTEEVLQIDISPQATLMDRFDSGKAQRQGFIGGITEQSGGGGRRVSLGNGVAERAHARQAIFVGHEGKY